MSIKSELTNSLSSTEDDGGGSRWGLPEWMKGKSMANLLAPLAPGASFISEIWQGYKNDGERFWLTSGRLEKLF